MRGLPDVGALLCQIVTPAAHKYAQDTSLSHRIAEKMRHVSHESAV